jgi:hypothetical protein
MTRRAIPRENNGGQTQNPQNLPGKIRRTLGTAGQPATHCDGVQPAPVATHQPPRRQTRRSVTGQRISNPLVMTEAQWQSRVIDYGRLRGWRIFHPYDSRRSAAGFPDLSMVRSGRLLLVELKSTTGRLTRDQCAWLADLDAVAAIETYVWRPADWPTVLEVLK